MAFAAEKLLDRLTAGIGGLIARIAYRDDETANVFFAFFFMLVDRHGRLSGKFHWRL